ncbi:dihydropteroate synthase [Paracoccus sp. S-4012]|uniref:dihydropteroate synthase n=1 Tax=Paracoccus sp. S-4012 TaxID=2665648 RepID=UPI0012B0FB72|nr:dihydropteroate synthase [Paracoccus sp. S-4012]MRX50526.1 dihydropteroate synthase [Paracoccus sp. S-4012]
MTDRRLYRPVPAESGLPLAGGWVRFSRIETLRAGRAPEELAAEDAPPEVLETLTAPRPDFADLALDRPQLMGIVNVTPDSFSDGGLWADPADAVAHGRNLGAQGATILDIGGESTRPGAEELPTETEAARILPVLEALSGQAVLSADTRKAAVAREAVAAGAAVVNDVSGLDFDPGMAAAVAATGAHLVLMHAQGLPATMQADPRYGDVVFEVYEALEARVARAEAAGIPRARIAVDPGIGFGKTAAHNLALLRRISVFHGLGCAVLLGVSRKRFIGTVGAPAGGDLPAPARDPGSLAVTLAAVAQGVQIHRVHNVADAAQGLALWQAVTR